MIRSIAVVFFPSEVENVYKKEKTKGNLKRHARYSWNCKSKKQLVNDNKPNKTNSRNGNNGERRRRNN